MPGGTRWARCRGRCTFVLTSDTVSGRWHAKPSIKMTFLSHHSYLTRARSAHSARTHAVVRAKRACTTRVNACATWQKLATATCVWASVCGHTRTYICSKSLSDGCSNLRPRLVTQQRINVRSTRWSVHRATHSWWLHLSQSAARVPLTTSHRTPCGHRGVLNVGGTVISSLIVLTILILYIRVRRREPTWLPPRVWCGWVPTRRTCLL